MKSDNRQMAKQLLLYVFAILGAAAVVYSGFFSALSDRTVPTARAQQDPFLSQRLNRIEQQFTSIESRLIRLEQESRFPSTTPRLPDNNNQAEISLLRSQMEILRLRVEETECGLLRLDERTLSAAVKQARNKSETPPKPDVCRSNSGAPLELSARP